MTTCLRAGVALGVLLAAVAGPTLDAATAAAPAASRYVFFVDCSASIGPEQYERWMGQAALLVARMRAGDRLTIHAIHDNTSGAAALFEGDVPAARTLSGRRQRLQFGQRAAAGFRCPDTSRRGRETDVIGAIARVRPDPRPTVLYVFSDMLNSTVEANLEHKAVDQARLAATIREILRRHGWATGQLTGVTVHCVLTALAEGDRPVSPNNRQALMAFYRTLLQAVGAHLASFDTEITRASDSA